MICNVIGAFIGACVTVFVLLASDVKMLDFGKKTATVEEIWTEKDLSRLARTNKLEAAISRLTSAAADESGALVVDLEEIQKVIDAADEEDIRTALLKAADGKGGREEDPLAAFASTVNAAATCGTSGTAGGDGFDMCVKRCEHKPSRTTVRATRTGACYTLCSLAVAPCVYTPFSWEEFSKNWVAPTKSSMAYFRHRVGGQVEAMTPEFSTVAGKAGAMASLARARGVEMAQSVAASEALASLSFGASAAVEALQTPRALKVMFLLILWFALEKYAKAASRTLLAATSEMDKRVTVAEARVRRLRLRQPVVPSVTGS